MFERIKEISNIVSKKTAEFYAKRVNKDFKSDSENGEIDPNKCFDTIQLLCSKYGISAQYGPVQSGGKMPDGKLINFIAFTQSFYKEASILTEFVTELGNLFVIEDSKKKRKGQNKSNDESYMAGYFIQGEETYAIDKSSGEILHFKGQQTAGGDKNEQGQIMVSLNIEHESTLDDLVHELVHGKIPTEIPQSRIPHDQIDLIGEEIQRKMGIQLVSPLRKIDILEKERLQIIDLFIKFDEDLGNTEMFRVK